MIEDLKNRTEREADVRECQALGASVKKTSRAKSAALVRVHHDNIERYLHLLRTKLTASERQLVERHLSVDLGAVDQLISGCFGAAPAHATDGNLRGSNCVA
ncbi:MULTISPECIES: hypothetical protein [Bradyrhizobium]|uniref:hypothetical protein n=1 Tax=Bradyrhizobium TaxID=374 RepID=UPI0011DE38FF|nr:hypothetical protein [Bradyrhizobium japonicum]MBR0731589.1 hypothetical protein [Bradyrhizobium japonicum]MCD9112614.1 hypothetical protein [Bradyrhizobium japonicum]MCD9256951.1 hypothetical protein [Bradyrhizobium japonicum SEMIA 5079]MCD9822209.1 hypothetical protein [Bradyrhizobium japonicum]MCD9894229.1 hypothetical protein [Bradyrhizobium japonicum]